MSKYTTEVRFICETASGLNESKGYTDVDTIITNAIPKIFTFTFPIFDENYRTVLEKKILKHFYTREICEETVGLWKLRLDTKLNELMPYYNKMYNSELLEFNPLYTANLTRTNKTDYKSNRDTSNSGNVNSTNSSNGKGNGTGSGSGTGGNGNGAGGNGTGTGDGTGTGGNGSGIGGSGSGGGSGTGGNGTGGNGSSGGHQGSNTNSNGTTKDNNSD